MKLFFPKRLLEMDTPVQAKSIANQAVQPNRWLIVLALVLFSVLARAQNTVSGSVKNTAGEPVKGVTVKVEKTTIMAITDEKGNFAIKATIGQTLSFSSVGYTANSVKITGSNPVNVVLAIKIDDNEDVVVVGYLQQKKPDVSTAISTVSPKNTDKGGYSNFQQVLAGRAAGINVMENNSEPGGGINIEIRGVSSISGSTQPLYVIDGVPIEQPDMNLNGSSQISSLFGNNLTANPLAMLNPNDIENIEILKDAAATSLYGSRGANGVVVITTKSGKVGKPKIVINYNQSVNSPQKRVDILDGQEFAAYANEAWALRKLRGLATATADTPFLAREISSLPSYDHQRDLAGSSVTRDASISISGGAIGGAKYYVSGQYFDQRGVITGTYLKRYSGRINFEMPLSTRLSLNVNLGVTATDRFGTPTQTLTSRALNWSPTTPLLKPDGDFNNLWDYRFGTGDASFIDPRFGTVFYNSRFSLAEINAALGDVESSQSRLNPLSLTSERGVRNANTSSQVLATAGLNYKFNNDFSVQGKISVNQFKSLLEAFIPINIPLPFTNYRGEANSGNSQNNSVLYQVNFNYRKKLGTQHTINTALVFSAEKFVQKSQRSVVGNFNNNITGFNNLGAALPQSVSSNYTGNQLLGSILQVNYLYKRSIVINLSSRYDGVSKFTEGKQFGLFPAASVAWKMEQEKWFMPVRNVISEAKFRASWGLVGNQAIDAYATQSTLTPNFSVWGNNFQTIGFSPARLGNPNLTWETTSNSNLALDLSLFRGRITTTAEVYRRRTKNLLFQIQTPPSSGFSTMFDNIGTLLNEGLDLTLGAKIINNRNFKWAVEGNINFNRNLVEKLRTDNPNEFYTAGNLTNNVPTLRVAAGRAVGAFYGLRSIGLWDSASIASAPVGLRGNAREGERRYADLNGDSLLNDLDRTWLGSALPKAFGGFNTTITYKNFEVTAFFSYAYGHQVFNQFEINWGTMTGLNNVRNDTYNRRYRFVFPGTDPNTANEIRESNKRATAVVAGTTADQRESTDYFIEDADYVRCRDISFSYKVPARFIKRLKVQGIQLYGNVQNLFIVTRYTGFNPEIGASSGRGFARGMDNGAAPLARAYRLGCSITL
ncbi:MAG: SusC/RagA family TonB-linked outer membrane protein [Dinghuibacter sp.]|nr:SusC/RagA family TonB-linked outer membrane protein [Dinghuibacter sp.]